MDKCKDKKKIDLHKEYIGIASTFTVSLQGKTKWTDACFLMVFFSVLMIVMKISSLKKNKLLKNFGSQIIDWKWFSQNS